MFTFAQVENAAAPEPTEILMSRANSVKKAIKQIMDHTDVGMSLW